MLNGQATGAALAGGRLHLLLHTRSHVGVLAEETVHHGGRGGGAQDRCIFQLTRQMRVTRAALAHHRAGTDTVNLPVIHQRRLVAHKVGAFDLHIGRAEAHAVAAQGVDGEEAGVGLARSHRLNRLGGSIEENKVHR